MSLKVKAGAAKITGDLCHASGKKKSRLVKGGNAGKLHSSHNIGDLNV
jgi:hypothetical protein